MTLVRGKEGTTVDLVIQRGDAEIPLTIERRIIDIETVIYKMLDNQIGYIQLTEFDTITIEQFNDALDALDSQGMTSLILDLRDNSGGDYDSFIAVTDRVLPKGIITTVVDKQGNNKTETSDEEHQVDIPMVVLINGNSASAAELLRRRFRITVLQRLSGNQLRKRHCTKYFRLPDGSGLKFTTEEYLTPDGNHINGIGITPDIEVAIPEEAYDDGLITEEEDTQLQTAIDVLIRGTEEANR